MKKALIYFTLVVGITAIIGACKKSDDDSTASNTPTSCSETASGTITGIDNMSLSGSYSMMLQYGERSGIDNSTGCTSDAGLGISAIRDPGDSTFGYHKDRRMRTTRSRNSRHYRCIYDPQGTDSFDPAILIDNRCWIGIRSHFTGS